MSAPLVLIAFIALASTAGRTFLLRASWVQTSPRWGIWAWQTLTVAIASAIVLVAVTVAIPFLPIRSYLAEIARITPLQLDAHYNTPGGPWVAAVALLAAAAMAGRVVALSAFNVIRAGRERRSQLDKLALVGERHPDGYVVIEHRIPLVYCLPGRGRRVVVTSGALSLLSAHELKLVLAHERTHLRARHDLALSLTDALARTFVGLRVFEDARAQITTLVEMQADDAARARGDRRAMARALVLLAVGGQGATADVGGSAAARVRRLSSSGLVLGRRRGAAVALASVLLLAAPIGLALAPAIEAAAFDGCEAGL